MSAVGHLRLLERPGPKSRRREEARTWHPARGGRRVPVLYVAGESDNRMVLARVLRRFGRVTLLVVRSGRAALAAAVERGPRLVVVDAGVVDMDAAVLVGALRQGPVPSSTSIVVVAQNATPKERARLIWAGATVVLGPPLDADEVERAVGTLLEVACWR